MRQLLHYFVKHFGFLYESPDRRIVDSGTPHAVAAEAFLEIRTSAVRWRLSQERFTRVLGVGAVGSDNMFSTELVQQYLEQLPDMPHRHLSDDGPGLAWIEAHVDTIESMFGDERTSEVIEDLIRLREANAERRWGPLPRRDER